MPGVDGTTLIARARIDSPSTIRVVLSGFADKDQSQDLMSLAHRYLNKPCEAKQIEECIDRCLATQSLIESRELRGQLGAVGALPPLPSTFAALQHALLDPGVDLRNVSATIEKDPGVSAKVLQVCNSAFFRLPRRMYSIKAGGRLPGSVNRAQHRSVRRIIWARQTALTGTRPRTDATARAQRCGNRARSRRRCPMGRGRVSCRSATRCWALVIGEALQGSDAASARGHGCRDAPCRGGAKVCRGKPRRRRRLSAGIVGASV